MAASPSTTRADGDVDDVPVLGVPPVPLQRHDQPERARRVVPAGRQDHHITDPADGQALAVQQRPAPQPGREHLAAGHARASAPSASSLAMSWSDKAKPKS